jgi:spermidine synthase
LDDPRVELAIEDGVAYVNRTRETYDLVIVDSTDPFGPATPLFGSEFYAGVHKVLSADGIVVSQAGSPFYDAEAQLALAKILGEQFRGLRIYNYSNLTYPGGLWSFTFATKGDLCPIGDFDPARVDRSGLDFRYYNASVHRAAFLLPEFQAQQLAGHLTAFKKGPFAS